jgi:hypothetical protein
MFYRLPRWTYNAIGFFASIYCGVLIVFSRDVVRLGHWQASVLYSLAGLFLMPYLLDAWRKRERSAALFSFTLASILFAVWQGGVALGLFPAT